MKFDNKSLFEEMSKEDDINTVLNELVIQRESVEFHVQEHEAFSLNADYSIANSLYFKSIEFALSRDCLNEAIGTFILNNHRYIFQSYIKNVQDSVYMTTITNGLFCVERRADFRLNIPMEWEEKIQITFKGEIAKACEQDIHNFSLINLSQKGCALIAPVQALLDIDKDQQLTKQTYSIVLRPKENRIYTNATVCYISDLDNNAHLKKCGLQFVSQNASKAKLIFAYLMAIYRRLNKLN